MKSKGIRDKFEYFLVLCAALVCRILPKTLTYRFSDILSLLLRFFARKRGKLAEDNLKLIYGDELTGDELTGDELTDAERKSTVNSVFLGLTDLFVEFLQMPYIEGAGIRRLVPSVTGAKHLDDALRQGNGVLLVSAHIGNWELLTAYISVVMGHKFNVIYREQSNYYIDRLIYKTREKLGIDPIPKIMVKKVRLKDKEIMFRDESFNNKVLARLRRNEIVGVMIDQDPYPSGIRCAFMGKEAFTTFSPIVYSKRTGAPVIPVFCVRESRGAYRLIIEAPIVMSSENDKRKQKLENVAMMNESVERIIDDYRDQWLWLHNRWKPH